VPALARVQPVHPPHALVIDRGIRAHIDMDDVVAQCQLAQNRIDRVRPAGERPADGRRDPQQEPGIRDARGEDKRPCSLQCGDDPLQVGSDRRQVEPAAQRIVHADEHGGQHGPRGQRPRKLLVGHVADERTAPGQVAHLDLVRGSQRLGQECRPATPPALGHGITQANRDRVAKRGEARAHTRLRPGVPGAARGCHRGRPPRRGAPGRLADSSAEPSRGSGPSPCARRKPSTAVGQPNRSA
jgi:hypothetical protein